MKINQPEIECERIVLRELKISDAPEILFLRSDSVVNKFVKRNTPENLDEAIEFIRRIRNETESSKIYYWSIALKSQPKMIGSICLWKISEDRKVAEVGYDLHPHFQKKGIMDEALRAVLKFAFQTLFLQHVEAFTHFDNQSSIKLLERNSFLKDENRSDESNDNNRIFIREREKIIE
ncbi:MAG: GNAT family N-acetyltransferase [Daejeonella sp.]